MESFLVYYYINRGKTLLYNFKIHTRWKIFSRTLASLLFVLSLVSFFIIQKVSAGPSKLVLYQGLKKMEINSKICTAGIYLKNSTQFTCACVTGVWGFYNKYCEKPISIAGGDNYCFRVKNQSFTEVVSFGNPKHPFEASVNFFHKDYFLMTDFYTDDNDTLSSPSSSFLTITDTSWTIYGDKGDALCLKAVTSGKRKFCLFRKEMDKKRSASVKNPTIKWNSIVKIKRGCLTTNVQRADSCSDILPPNDFGDCGFEAEDDVTEAPDEGEGRGVDDFLNPSVDSSESDNTTNSVPEGWIKIKSIKDSESTTTESSVPDGWIRIKPNKYIEYRTTESSVPEGWIKIKSIKDSESTTTESSVPDGWIKIKPNKNNIVSTTESSVSDGWIKIYPKKYTTPKSYISTTTESTSSSSEEWIPFPIPMPKKSTSTTTRKPRVIIPSESEDNCNSEVTRDKVKEYWIDPESNMCSKSINEAVFTDQLRRFTVKQFDKIFESRLKSLTQMEHLLNYTKLIMQKTCGEDYVPGEFFQVAFNAFMMFLREDFFYGVEGAVTDVYPRILQALRQCLENAKPYVFETDTLDCGIKKINGFLILPGKRDSLTVPARHAYKDFEPLIETMWKMFLNTHSLCFPDFQFSNDYHHFSVLIMELFSKSIYEKWIEPLESQDLYSFILPNFNFLKETQENIDYCVAAAEHTSACPAWMSRSAVPAAKSRKKRSIWVDNKGTDKRHSEIWNGEAFCLQKMDDPELRLGFPKCYSKHVPK